MTAFRKAIASSFPIRTNSGPGAGRQRLAKVSAGPSQVTPPLYIALRFLSHRKRAFILSLSGVVFGVAIFICTQAQTQGFAKNFIDSTLGSNGALLLRRASIRQRRPARSAEKRPRPNSPAPLFRWNHQRARDHARQPAFPDVAACSPVLRGTLSARAGFDNATVDLFGIDPALHLQTTNLGQQITAGNFDDFRNNPNAIIIGSRLADALEVAPATPAIAFAGRRISPLHRRRDRAQRRRVVDAVRVYCQSRRADAPAQTFSRFHDRLQIARP